MRLSDRAILWLAEGFGSGRMRPAPGTWGSLVGCILGYPLLALPPAPAIGVTLTAILLAVPVCSRAETLLGRIDPGSVVLDEIVAIPLTVLPLHVGVLLGAVNPPRFLTLAPTEGLGWFAAFTLFRALDIGKPWPIGALQNLPRGWGIVMDDVAAGLIAGLILLGVAWTSSSLPR